MKFSLFGFRLNLFVVLFLFFLIVLFFLVYQVAIGNPFLEEIHPAFVLVIFIIFLGISTYLISTFRVIFRNGKIFLRDGFRIKIFGVEDVVEVLDYSLDDSNKSFEREVEFFDFGKGCFIEFRLKSGEIVVVSSGDKRVCNDFLKFFKKS